ncbi:MAG: adenylate kinase [Bacteroidaceae bacterium]|nr:adenylate kinase [Bacteroidaceae bacterium]
MKNVIIFGAPGSGKGTYSEEIVNRYGMGHISTGDVLRAQIKAGTELGKTAKNYIDNGQLLPDSLMIDILADTYDSMPAGKGVIFDGFPRTIPQAEALKEMLAKRNHDMGVMVELVVDEKVLLARLLNRAIEQGRADDNEETIKKRFAVYREQTAPLAEWFEKEGMRHTFVWKEGEMTKEDMLNNIYALLDTLK